MINRSVKELSQPNDRDGISSVQQKANKPKSLYSSKKKNKTKQKTKTKQNGPRIVKTTLGSIWTNPFDDLSSYANRECKKKVGSTGSTGFRTNKRYAILLEF